MPVFDLAAETREFIRRALDGDPALASLAVAGSDAATLTAVIAPGTPPARIGGNRYTPAPPFRRELVAELVVRMQRQRWYRLVGGELVEPIRDDIDGLKTFYPRSCYASCGPGWSDLLHAMLEWTDETDGDKVWSFDDIKEKYATLRLYCHGDLSASGEEIIEACEHLSGYVCDRCGRPGRLVGKGWISTRCELHDGDHR